MLSLLIVVMVILNGSGLSYRYRVFDEDDTDGFLGKRKVKMARPVEGFSDGMDTIGEVTFSNKQRPAKC